MHADIPLSADDRPAILKDKDIQQNFIDILRKFYYGLRYEATCKQVASDYGMSFTVQWTPSDLMKKVVHYFPM